MTYLNFENYATGAQPYELENPVTQWPVALNDLRAYLKINNNREDNLLKGLIESATSVAEAYTKKDFITKDYITYRDVFGDLGEKPLSVGYPPVVPYNFISAAPIVLRKSPLVSITEISYLLDGVVTVLDPSAYRIIKKAAYSQIIPTGQYWPTADFTQQSITIKFKAGYGEDAKGTPAEIKTAISEVAANYYVNRGDFSDETKAIPETAKAIFNRYTIRSMVP